MLHLHEQTDDECGDTLLQYTAFIDLVTKFQDEFYISQIRNDSLDLLYAILKKYKPEFRQQ